MDTQRTSGDGRISKSVEVSYDFVDNTISDQAPTPPIHKTTTNPISILNPSITYYMG